MHRTYADGSLKKQDDEALLQSWLQAKLMSPPESEWEEMGPWQYDHEQAMEFLVQSPGAAHAYTVEQSLSNPDIIYAGMATAGIWKSIDKGMNWSLVSKDLPFSEVYSIAIDPVNSDIVYCEGGGQIWKTTNGGSSWTMTGDASFQSESRWVRDLKVYPGNSNTLLAATDDGLLRSQDGGNSWTTILSGEYMEIEFKPDDPSIVYTVRLAGNGTRFYRSADGGLTFTQITNGWPSPPLSDEQKRCEISVSPANPNLVYVLASGVGDGYGGLYGIYLSTDAGLSFSYQCCGTGPGGAPEAETNPNILGWSGDGSGEGGQYYYDLAMDVSPTNPDKVFSAGISMWRSENAGIDWSLNAHWVTWATPETPSRYTHADVHDVKFFPNGAGSWDMWIASDGGVFYSSDEGDNIEPRMYGIQGTDFWGFQAGFQDGDVMVGGTYHNGTLIKYNDIYKYGKDSEESGGWLAEGAGDNIRGFVNPGDNKLAYDDGGSFEYSEVRELRPPDRAFNGDFKCTTSYWAGEYGNYAWHPYEYNTFYSPVGNTLYITTDGGQNFEPVHDFGGEKIIQVLISPIDPDYIYVTHAIDYWNHTIHRSTDGGESWTEVNPSSSETDSNDWRHKYLTLDGYDPMKIWCILIGNQTGNKVFRSVNGGDSWMNISGNNLINEECVSISHQLGTDEGIYIGTRHGVFYKNASMNDWLAYSTGLPASVNCFFLQPYYGKQKIRTATNRGVFQSDFYENSNPIARFSAEKRSLNIGNSCEAQSIRFSDYSIMTVDENSTWTWSFEGGIPSSSTERNPEVIYSSEGTFNVSLTITDQFGSHTVIRNSFINIQNDKVDLPYAEDFEQAFPPEDWKLFNPGTSAWEWDWVPGGENENKVASYPNYWVNSEGFTTQMILPAMDFTGTINPTFNFEYTHRNFQAYIDGLAIKYRTDENPNWQTLWEVYDPELNVEGTFIWWWDTENSDVVWRNESIDLSSLTDEDCVQFAIENIGGYGNHTWVDNIRIGTTPRAIFNTNANAPCTEDSVYFVDSSLHNPDQRLWEIEPATYTFLNGTNANSTNLQIRFDEPGNYSITLTVSNEYGSHSESLDNFEVMSCDCYGDLNSDNQVDVSDLLLLLADFGCIAPPDCMGDLNANGAVTSGDMISFLSVFGATCE